jgi:uncharacterized GH25 family protein
MMRSASILLASLLLSVPLSAHDFWIEPSTFRPAAGGVVTASLRVGQQVHGDPVPRMPPLIELFVLRGAGGESPVIGRPGSDPAGIARINEGGLHWIGYQSNAYPVTLDGSKFESYLKDEGLERIVALRAKKGQSAAPGRERFYRCAKALLDTPGTATEGVLDAPLGFTLELVPRRNPYTMNRTLEQGSELPLSLTFRGKPIAGILVVAMNKEHPEQAVRARTDAKGRVALRLAQPGFFLVKAVHMDAAPAGSGVDWESWWASLTFDVQ